MYMSFDTDPEKNSRFGIIVFLICIAAIMLTCAHTCNGQICIQHKQNTSYYTPCRPIILKSVSDTSKKLAIGIYVENDKAIMYINYFNRDNTSIDTQLHLGVVGDKVEVLKPRGLYDNVNYIEFVLTDKTIQKMKSKKVDYIAIVSSKYYKPWASILSSPDSYFMDFLNNYNKQIDVEILESFYSKN